MRYRRYTGVSLTPVWTIMGVNFLLFLATTVAPQLVFFLGIQPASFLSRPWTIVTSIFVHGGFGHIIVNMLALYFFGSYTLRLLGKVRFQLVYFSGGIMGGLFFVWLGSPLATAVGASGAVFALGGLLAVMQPMLRVFIFPIPVPIPIWVAVIGGFFIISSGVAWQAHLGGLAFGLAAGYVFRRVSFRTVEY